MQSSKCLRSSTVSHYINPPNVPFKRILHQASKHKHLKQLAHRSNHSLQLTTTLHSTLPPHNKQQNGQTYPLEPITNHLIDPNKRGYPEKKKGKKDKGAKGGGEGKKGG